MALNHLLITYIYTHRQTLLSALIREDPFCSQHQEIQRFLVAQDVHGKGWLSSKQDIYTTRLDKIEGKEALTEVGGSQKMVGLKVIWTNYISV